MNKRQRKKQLKTQPRSCPICGRRLKAERWGNWYQIGCWRHGCTNGVFMISKNKKSAIKGWNALTKSILEEEA